MSSSQPHTGSPFPPQSQSQSQFQSPNHHQTLDPYDTDTNSILAPSTITPDIPPSSFSSTRRLHPHSSQSTLRALSISSSSTAPLHPNDGTATSRHQQRRATVAYLADLRAARAPHLHPKPKKTKGRRTFELISNVVDFVVPVDVDSGKTSMKESSLGRLVLKRGDQQRQQKKGGVGGCRDVVVVGDGGGDDGGEGERRRSVAS